MISDSIIKTLKYSDHFGFPLTEPELHARLIQFSCTKSDLTKAITAMVKGKKIDKREIYYCLPGQTHHVSKRSKNAQTSRPAQLRAKNLAAKLSKVPGVLAIYTTGSLAMSNSTTNSDIDFMIITKNNQLWTTRFLLTIVTSLIGLRRTPGSKQNSGKLCLNLYLTPASFSLPSSKRSLYTAYELIQAVPLYDPQNTRSMLLSANAWIHDFLPNFPLPKKTSKNHGFADLPAKAGSPIHGFTESLLYQLQFFYMKNKITREYVTQDAAFFHPSDPGRKILKKLALE